MKDLPEKLYKKLRDRELQNSLRGLSGQSDLVDFSSNDYLGFAASDPIFRETHQFLKEHSVQQNGSTGSRLLSGNHKFYILAENMLCAFHKSEAAVVFNSGYDANLGFFSSVPQRGDVIFYDEYSHASIRDGIKMSNARAYKFKHNDLEALDKKLAQTQYDGAVYIVTESVFSMDGDSPDLQQLTTIVQQHKAFLIVDEAHAVGVFGTNGCGLLQQLGLENACFARIVTFGKAPGCHGAVVLGSKTLKNYLINFARSLIYTTALSPHAVASILIAYQQLQKTPEALRKLKTNISSFNTHVKRLGLEKHFIKSRSAIHCCILPGNDRVKNSAAQLQQYGFDVRPILSPTVPEGQERLRFCLHSYNSEEEIAEVLQCLATFAR